MICQLIRYNWARQRKEKVRDYLHFCYSIFLLAILLNKNKVSISSIKLIKFTYVVFELEGRFLSIPGSSFPRDDVNDDPRQMAKNEKQKTKQNKNTKNKTKQKKQKQKHFKWKCNE